MVKLATPEQAQEKKATRAAFGVTLAELAASGKTVSYTHLTLPTTPYV